MGEIKMSKKELSRVEILERVSRRALKQAEAGAILNLSIRQIKRLVKRIKTKGIEGICHQSRGKPSRRKIKGEEIQKMIQLYQEKYRDFGVTFFNEKLKEEGIEMSRETVRKYLSTHQLWEVKRSRKKAIHVWRERRSCEGELIQIDGSHHRWLEDRLDQEFCLMGYIDDATSQVFARFYEYEGIYPILDSMILFIKNKGFPRAVYVDRHSTYKTTRKASHEEDLNDTGALTQFQSVMKDCDIEVIHAHSPQAKGRVERLFSTLQDRLVKEMRLANISSLSAANDFLESYLISHNQRFGVAPNAECPIYRSVPKDFDFHWTFAKRDTRKVHSDYTIHFKNRLFLIKKPSITLKGQSVEVRQALNGDLKFTSNSKLLDVKECFLAPKSLCTQKMSMAESKRKLQEALNTLDGPKSKKSWLDDLYFQQPVSKRSVISISS